ncbi:MAG TPA: phosphomannomutase/phosphoglucomutase, partial [Candidatus Gracilibacteria bacterium]|nr:phosphomannomutase/phosphoglucomutase [Candidatus Gracilibacteria bacterium]
LQKTGVQVLDLGYCFSPLVYFSACHTKLDGAVNVTASHNPKEYNGFKLQNGTQAIFADELQKLYQLIVKNELIQSSEIQEIQNLDLWPSYVEKIQSILAPSKKSLKVVVDAGNGVTGKYAPEILRLFGYEVVELFCELDGNFPNHPADPEEAANMKDLQAKVLEEKADLGIAFDGDGDRVGVVDNQGKIYGADHLLVMLAQDALSRYPGATIVQNVSVSTILKVEVEKRGGKLVECPVGHSYVEAAMHENQAILGGESSAHIFFGEDYYGYDDAILAALKILNILTHRNWADIMAEVPVMYNTPNLKYSVPEAQKFAFIDEIAEELFPGLERHRLDGVKIFWPDNSWLIFRASNTTPKVVLRIESPDPTKLAEIRNQAETLIQAKLANLNSK